MKGFEITIFRVDTFGFCELVDVKKDGVVINTDELCETDKSLLSQQFIHAQIREAVLQFRKLRNWVREGVVDIWVIQAFIRSAPLSIKHDELRKYEKEAAV